MTLPGELVLVKNWPRSVNAALGTSPTEAAVLDAPCIDYRSGSVNKLTSDTANANGSSDEMSGGVSAPSLQ